MSGVGVSVDIRIYMVVRGGVDYLMYRTLAAAVGAARPGDDIEEWIALDGSTRLLPVRIWKVGQGGILTVQDSRQQ